MKKLIYLTSIFLTNFLTNAQDLTKKELKDYSFEYPIEWKFQSPGGFGEDLQLSIPEENGYGHITIYKEPKENSFEAEVKKAREIITMGGQNEKNYSKVNQNLYKLTTETNDPFDNSIINIEYYFYDYKTDYVTVSAFYTPKNKTYFEPYLKKFLDSFKLK